LFFNLGGAHLAILFAATHPERTALNPDRSLKYLR
jgi:hypothetical protein